MRDAKF